MNIYTKTIPKKWSGEEIEQLKQDKASWMNISELAEKYGRSEVSISIKLKRLWKKNWQYNKQHIQDKYDTNYAFKNIIQPKNVLDLYCWVNMWWANNCMWNVYSNDKDKSINCEYHEDAERLINRLWLEWDKFDVIDLDPYGSAFECFDKAIRMATKWLIITLWEMWHKRFKRLDFVRYRYDIETLEEFTVDRLINKIQRIGKANKKQLTPIFVKEWNRIARVYFKVEPIKITEQWNLDNN